MNLYLNTGISDEYISAPSVIFKKEKSSFLFEHDTSTVAHLLYSPDVPGIFFHF